MSWNWREPTIRIPTKSDSPKHIVADDPSPEKLLIQQLRGAVARGWCDDKNCMKEMDGDLAESIVREILLSLEPDCHPSHALPLRWVRGREDIPSTEKIAMFCRTFRLLNGDQEPDPKGSLADVWSWLLTHANHGL